MYNNTIQDVLHYVEAETGENALRMTNEGLFPPPPLLPLRLAPFSKLFPFGGPPASCEVFAGFFLPALCRPVYIFSELSALRLLILGQFGLRIICANSGIW